MKLELKQVDNSLESLFGFSGRIYFGVPEDKSARRKIFGRHKNSGEHSTGINNADLLFILEHGSPVKNIPPRPLLKPVIEKHRPEIEKVFIKVYNALVNGDTNTANYEMDKLAQRIEMWGKKYFVEENGWAPNKESTIKRKGSSRPMIDTGQLRSSIRGIYVDK